MSEKHAVPPAQLRAAQEATSAQLIEAYNAQASAVRTVNAGVLLSPVAGSTYSGVIEEYHDVNGFILAAQPGMLRMIGQAPVVAKDIFDMVSDGQTFRIYIPSKNQFLVGSTELERRAKSPIENLRPQHILDAVFWPSFAPDATVLFEQFDETPARFYILTLLRRGEAGLEIARKVWFDRRDLRVSRVQIYGPGGRLDADIAYSDWQNGDGASQASGAAAAATPGGVPPFAREIRMTRPQEDYQLSISITKLTLNADIAADRFVLEQPPGSELIHVGQDETGAQQRGNLQPGTNPGSNQGTSR